MILKPEYINTKMIDWLYEVLLAYYLEAFSVMYVRYHQDKLAVKRNKVLINTYIWLYLDSGVTRDVS